MTEASDSRARVARRVLNVALVTLVVLHIVPLPGDPDWMLLGFLPWDLAYPLLWIIVATAVVVFMTGPPWPDEPPPSFQPRPPEPTEPSE